MDLIFLLLNHFPDETVRNEVDRLVLRYKHPALAELHDKYCSKSDSLDRQLIVQKLKLELDFLCKKTIQNRAENDATDMSKLVRELRKETESRNKLDQELERNQQMILSSYAEYLDQSLELVKGHRIPFKNTTDMTQSYVFNSRVQTEAALNRKNAAERVLALCPDSQHVTQRKSVMDQLCARISSLEMKKRAIQERMQQIESAIDPEVVQEYRMVREDLMEKEWAAAQLKNSPS